MAGVVRTESETVYIRGNVTNDATEIDYVDENGDTHCIDVATLMSNFANCEIDLTINKITEENVFIFDREIIPAIPVDQEDEAQIVPDDDDDENRQGAGEGEANTNNPDNLDDDDDENSSSGEDATIGKID